MHGLNYFANPHFLLVGPDANVWFTAGSDALARITLSGEVTKHYLPPDCGGFGLQQYGNPYGLTVTAGLWSGWLVNQQTVIPLWFAPIPPVSPEVLFDVPLTGFPNVGPVGVITALIDASPGACGDVRAIDTGTPE